MRDVRAAARRERWARDFRLDTWNYFRNWAWMARNPDWVFWLIRLRLHEAFSEIGTPSPDPPTREPR